MHGMARLPLQSVHCEKQIELLLVINLTYLHVRFWPGAGDRLTDCVDTCTCWCA